MQKFVSAPSTINEHIKSNFVKFCRSSLIVTVFNNGYNVEIFKYNFVLINGVDNYCKFL